MIRKHFIAALILPLLLVGCGSGSTEGDLPLTPPEPVKPEDFSPVTGEWITEDENTEITVYDNGGYLVRAGEQKKEGYLREEEKNGQTVYTMYLESAEPYGENAALLIDSNYPDKLTFTEGMGAILLERKENNRQGFGTIAGDWKEKDVDLSISIGTDGSFVMTRNGVTTEGHLAAEEKEGNTRYVMYDKDDKALAGDCAVLIDPNYPDQLTFIEGMGAELLDRVSGGVAEITGKWKENGVDLTVKVYEDGSYVMIRGDKRTEGHLVAEETNGETRYALYDNDNNPLAGNPALTLDANHPGSLALIQGMGAELLEREAESVVTVDKFDNVAVQTLPLTEIELGESEVVEHLYIHAMEPVTDFNILRLEVKDVTQDGEISFNTSVLYHQDELTTQEELKAAVTNLGDLPNLGISYTDAKGTARYYAIVESGKDGSISLEPFEGD